MNKQLEKVLLLVGLEQDRQFFVECQRLFEEVELDRSRFTAPELVIVEVFLRKVMEKVAEHSHGLIPDFDNDAA